MNTDNFTPPFKKKKHIKCYSGKKNSKCYLKLACIYISISNVIYCTAVEGQWLQNSDFSAVCAWSLCKNCDTEGTLILENITETMRFSATSQLQKSLGGTKQHHHNLFKF